MLDTVKLPELACNAWHYAGQGVPRRLRPGICSQGAWVLGGERHTTSLRRRLQSIPQSSGVRRKEQFVLRGQSHGCIPKVERREADA